MESLRLRRPLAVLDLEATGRSPFTDRIVEIAVLKLYPNGERDFRCKRVHPGMPIPPEATRVHGITDADVMGEPEFARYARGLHEFLSDCDFAGFGIARFDLPLLRTEFQRAKIEFSVQGRAVIDALAIFHTKEPRDLAAAMEFFCGHAHPKPHASKEDVLAALEVLEAQLARYEDLPREVEALHQFCDPSSGDRIDSDGKFVWRDDVAVIAFGRHEGTPLAQLARELPDYLRWVRNGNFSPEVKEIVRNALEGRFPERGVQI
ncbi:MAG: 3'-5' exonuclease [Chloroflexi bacterium]|nr:3'-5' exonuclease [Chloroflexota bacterium]